MQTLDAMLLPEAAAGAHRRPVDRQRVAEQDRAAAVAAGVAVDAGVAAAAAGSGAAVCSVEAAVQTLLHTVLVHRR